MIVLGIFLANSLDVMLNFFYCIQFAGFGNKDLQQGLSMGDRC
jgi:hypothetical protein